MKKLRDSDVEMYCKQCSKRAGVLIPVDAEMVKYALEGRYKCPMCSGLLELPK